MSKVCLSKLGFSRVVNYVVRSGFVPKYSIYHLLIRPPPKGFFCQLLVAVLFFLYSSITPILRSVSSLSVMGEYNAGNSQKWRMKIHLFPLSLSIIVSASKTTPSTEAPSRQLLSWMRVELRGSNVRFSTKPRKKEGYYCVPNSVV